MHEINPIILNILSKFLQTRFSNDSTRVSVTICQQLIVYLVPSPQTCKKHRLLFSGYKMAAYRKQIKTEDNSAKWHGIRNRTTFRLSEMIL